MAMSKQDYVAIAHAIRTAITDEERAGRGRGTPHTAAAVADHIAKQIALHCSRTNEKFNYDRFIEAAGVKAD